MSLQVAVIGAGVIGLSTAVCLQERIPNVNVTLIADNFLENTLSNGAGALFRGDTNIHSDLNLNKTWLKTSYIHFTKLANLAAAEEAAKIQKQVENCVNDNLLSNNSSNSTANFTENNPDLNENDTETKLSVDPIKNQKQVNWIIDEQNNKIKEPVDQLYVELNEINQEISNEKTLKKALEKTLGTAIGIPTIATTISSPTIQTNTKTINTNSKNLISTITSPSPCLNTNKVSAKSSTKKESDSTVLDHGVRLVYGFHLTEISERAVENKLMLNLIKDWHSLTIEELDKLSKSTNGLRFSHGYSYTTVMIEPGLYLRYLMSKFMSANGQTLKRNISFRSLSDFEFLRRNFHVVFNCTGLGAKKLMNDHQMVPIRGQTITIKFKNINNFYTFDGNYIYPRCDDTIVLGGCKQFDQWNQQVNKFDREMILHRCRQMLPSLDDAEVIGEFVGLRPYRSEIRIERERIYSPDKQATDEYINVVHNYGHGGSGFTYSYGTAVHAVKLIEDLVNQKEQLEILP